MARTAGSSIQIEWFNVTYRGVLTSIVTLILLGVVGLGTWYYLGVFAPRQSAGDAISRAERNLDQASVLATDERIVEIVRNAESSLQQARIDFGDARYDDSRIAAIRSDNWSSQAIRMAGGQGNDTKLVRFADIEGEVRVKRAGEFSWETGSLKMELHIGDQIKTSSSASAELIYFDGTVTTIRPGSLLEIRELFEDPVTKVRRVKEKLTWGEVEATTKHRNVSGSFHEVATEKAAARAEKEGEFRVKYDREKKTARFDVFQGDIEVKTADRRESLTAGESIGSTAKGRLGSKQALPLAPRLIMPRDQRVFITDEAALESLTLSWEAVAGAEAYHLMISDRPLFTSLLHDGRRTGPSATLGEVPPNSYYWKVAALSTNGGKGPYSNPSHFRVSSQKIRDRTDTEGPGLEITEFVPVGMMVIVNGRTEPGASLWVNDEKIDVYDDGTFYAVVRLRQEGMNALRFVAQDNSGNETKETRMADVELF